MPQWNGKYEFAPRNYYVDCCIDDPRGFIGTDMEAFWNADPDGHTERQFDTLDAARYCCDSLNQAAIGGIHFGVIDTRERREVYRTCKLLTEVR